MRGVVFRHPETFAKLNPKQKILRYRVGILAHQIRLRRWLFIDIKENSALLGG